MNVLNVSSLSKSYGTRRIFDRVSLAIDETEKVGFIGVNGSGKSTLFKIMAGLESADAGDVALRRGARVRYLTQEPEFTPGDTIRAAVAEGRPELRAAFAQYEEVGRRLSLPSADHDKLVQRHGELAGTIDRLGGWDWTHRVEAMLTQLGVDGWERRVEGLSGGEAKRVALARTLLAQPELLLLDEPTNHLDADTVLFLEEYLIEYAGAVALITHDRYFLDRVVDRMIEVSAGELTAYSGGYTEYLEAQAERSGRQAVVDAKRKRLIEKELEWARRSPPARTGKQRARLNRTSALEVESQNFARARTGELSLHAPDSMRLGRTVLNLHGITKAFGEHVLVQDFSTIMRAGERIGVIGPNGAGKTTLIRIILGEEPADGGEVELGSNTRIAYFDQLRTQLDSDVSVYNAAGGTDWIEIGGRRTHLRSYLEDFLFPTERQQQKVSSLSGGERNRLMLAKLFMQPSNLLILDEPTNDLDLVTLQVLEAALLEYPGCVLMVTHDRFFLDKIATGLFVFEGRGVVHRHEGGFELYRRLHERRDTAAAEAQALARAAANRPHKTRTRETARDAGSKRKKLTWKEERELRTLTLRIAEAEQQRDALSARLADPDLYQDATETANVAASFKQTEAEIEEMYTRWLELEDQAGE